MRWCVAAVLSALATIRVGSAAAQGDEDLDLIPSEVLEDSTDGQAVEELAQPPLSSRLFLEDAFSLWSPSTSVPVAYPAELVSWQNRLSLDVNLRWKPWKTLVINFSDRLSAFAEQGNPILSSDTFRNALREGYVAWQPPADHTYFEAGRVNIRKGVGLGFNPTDFFKTRTLVGQASLDPSVLRQNRLGTLLLRWQAIWSGGSASIAFAPKVADSPDLSNGEPGRFDPRFDATNDAFRLLCSIGFDVWDLNPEILAYFELGRSKLGLNLSRPVGDAVIAYAEWAGGPQSHLITRAIEYGQETGTLPPVAPIDPPNLSRKFRSDLVTGFSWTVATAVTLNIEYHYHQAGFSRANWRSWFDVGGAPEASPFLAAELWYLRAYASDQQEPISRHQLFLRAAWPRAFVTDLELTGFAFVSLLDGSVLSQVSASYYLSSVWTASAYASANLGDDRSERGSFPQRLNSILQLTRYF